MARAVRIQQLWSEKDAFDLDNLIDRVADEDLAGALHAIEGVDPEVESSDRDLLELWAGRVRERLIPPTRSSPVHGASVLREILGIQAGFRGDSEDYHNPQNSMLHRVLARRRGLPILLSAVWIHVGHSAGLPIYGIGLPGYFLVRIGSGAGTLTDPYFGGMPVSIEDCKRRVKEYSGGQISWTNAFLSPYSVDRIVERVLKNLLNSYQQSISLKAAYRSAEFLCALRRESIEYRLAKARAAHNAGAFDIARETYGSLLEEFPDAEEAALAEDALERIPTSPAVN